MLIPNILKAAPKYIFNKLTYSHDLAVTMRSYKAVNMDLNEAFKTALQTNVKTAKLLLSSGELNLNDFQDSKGNSHLMNILESKNTSLLKSYFNKAKVETSFKLFPLIPNNSGNTIYNIAAAADDKKVSKILYHKIAELHDLNKIEIQHKIDLFSDFPPAYEAQDSSAPSYPILGEGMF